jgi:hypothetical protein
MAILRVRDSGGTNAKKNYPFVIDIAETENKSSVYILTKTAGTHAVKLERMPTTL